MGRLKRYEREIKTVNMDIKLIEEVKKICHTSNLSFSDVVNKLISAGLGHKDLIIENEELKKEIEKLKKQDKSFKLQEGIWEDICIEQGIYKKEEMLSLFKSLFSPAGEGKFINLKEHFQAIVGDGGILRAEIKKFK